jgi:DNA replication protein DnaC
MNQALQNNLYQRASALKLYGLLAHWEQVKTASWVADLINWEDTQRSDRSLQRRLGYARIGRFKPLAQFDWSWPRQCDRQAIEELLSLEFLSLATNVILCGPNGVGKSTIACNIAYQTVLNGQTALLTTAGQMLNDLAAQDGDRALRRRIHHYAKPTLLCIDEVGYLSYSNRHADLLFEIISRRYEKKSTLVTTNKAFSEWAEIFPNAACVVSLVDRLVHHAEIIHIEAESYRVKESREKSARQKAARAQHKKASASTHN